MNFRVIIKKLFPIFILGLVCFIFYHKYFLLGLIPFPGDLLVSEYQPFRSYSVDEYVAGAVPNKAQYFDSVREFYPWRTFTTAELKKGNLPLWNPYNFSGTPHMANFQSAVFYPLNLLYLLIDQLDAWSILVLLQPFLASLFTYLYLKRIGLAVHSALFGGLVFAYSSYMNVWLEFNVVGHTILWLPLILYSIELLFDRIRVRSVLLISVSVISALFAGHPLDFGAIYAFSFVYLLYRLYQKRAAPRDYGTYCLIILLPLVGAFIQLIPTLELLKNSTRSMFSYDFLVNSLLVQPSQLIMLVVPDFFGNPATRTYWPVNSYVGITLAVGVVPLILLLLLFITKRQQKNKHYIYFLFAAIIVFLLTTKNPFSLLFYKVQIPVLSTIQPNKLLSLFMFSMAVLSGLAVENIHRIKKIDKKQVLIMLSVIIITLVICLLEAFFVANKALTVALKNTFLSFGVAFIALCLLFIHIRYIKVKQVTIILLFSLFLTEQYYSFQKFNPFSPRSFIFPNTGVISYLQENAGIDRFWGYGTAKIDSNIATHYKLFSSDGFDALNLKWYNEFIRTSKDGVLPDGFTHETRSVAEIEPGYGETDLISNTYRLKVLDALGTKYILDRVENPKSDFTFPADRFKLVWEDSSGWKIFENLKSAQRFFLTNNVTLYSSNDDFEANFFSPEFDPKTMVMIEEHEPIPPLCGDGEQSNTKVRLLSYEPSEVQFETNSNCNSFLYLSDTYDKNWEVKIDTNNTRVIKANYAFRGVIVPPGVHTVVFSYKLW